MPKSETDWRTDFACGIGGRLCADFEALFDLKNGKKGKKSVKCRSSTPGRRAHIVGCKLGI